MQQTKDYEKFSMLDFNRNLKRNHINELKEKIAKYGYLKSNPIIVNDGFEILDGQHRFTACKEMGLPITYQVVKDINDSLIIDLNTSQLKWTSENYINHYANKDHNPNYVRLQRMCKDYGLPATTILYMAKGFIQGGFQSKAIREGRLKFTLEEELKANSIFRHTEKIAKSLRQKQTSRFCAALVKVSEYKGFKWEVMESKAESHPTVGYKCRTAEEFEKMFKDLYNYHTKKEENRI